MATFDLDLDADDLDLLRGTLLAAKAAELAEFQRRAGRLSYGYGSDSAREGMSAELVQLRRRQELLEALLAALGRGSTG
jgi:hypothetical protein